MLLLIDRYKFLCISLFKFFLKKIENYMITYMWHLILLFRRYLIDTTNTWLSWLFFSNYSVFGMRNLSFLWDYSNMLISLSCCIWFRSFQEFWDLLTEEFVNRVPSRLTTLLDIIRINILSITSIRLWSIFQESHKKVSLLVLYFKMVMYFRQDLLLSTF